MFFNCRSSDSTERLLAYAEREASLNGRDDKSSQSQNAWRDLSVEERLKHSLVKVGDVYLKFFNISLTPVFVKKNSRQIQCYATYITL